MSTKNFVFENPVYILRVSEKDGRPCRGDQGFVWPEQGPVEDPNWEPKAECGHGLHGCRMDQIRKGISFMKMGEFPTFLVCEVESSEVVDLPEGGKCKFPRCNVIHFGSWRGALHVLNLSGEENVPSEDDILAWTGWKLLADTPLGAPLPPLPRPTTKEVNELVFGSQILPVLYLEWLTFVKMVKDAGKGGLSVVEARYVASLMFRANSPGRMEFWRLLQKNVNSLFAVHPFIERLMVLESSKPRGAAMNRFCNAWHDACEPAYGRLSGIDPDQRVPALHHVRVKENYLREIFQ